jgi:hypothetical protein
VSRYGGAASRVGEGRVRGPATEFLVSKSAAILY